MHSESVKELASALSKAQCSMGHARKDARNPHFQSTYADLASVREAIREPFGDHGLAVTQVIETTEHGIILRTMLMHSSGEWITSDFPLLGDLTRPQVLGSLLTYARRYSLAAIAGIAQDDDDANEAQSHADTRTARQAAPDRREAPRPKPGPKPGPPKAPKPQYRDWLDTFVEDINAKWSRVHPDEKPIINAFQLNKHLIKHLGAVLAKSEADNFKLGNTCWDAHSGAMAEEAVLYCRKIWKETVEKLKPDPREPGSDDGG